MSEQRDENLRMRFARNCEIMNLERAVVEAAIVWRQTHPDEKTLWLTEVVDALIAAKELRHSAE